MEFWSERSGQARGGVWKILKKFLNLLILLYIFFTFYFSTYCQLCTFLNFFLFSKSLKTHFFEKKHVLARCFFPKFSKTQKNSKTHKKLPEVCQDPGSGSGGGFWEGGGLKVWVFNLHPSLGGRKKLEGPGGSFSLFLFFFHWSTSDL